MHGLQELSLLKLGVHPGPRDLKERILLSCCPLPAESEVCRSYLCGIVKGLWMHLTTYMGMHSLQTSSNLSEGALCCCSQVVSVDELGQGIRLYGKGASSACPVCLALRPSKT